jgi:hypothetical protein
MKKIFLVTVIFPSILFAQISLDGFDSYSQNFDSLALSGTSTVLPHGWAFIETGTNANTTYTAGTGSSNTGDTYSFGPSGNSDRAFGGLLSGSLVPTIGANFRNNTGSTITQLPIIYTGEHWRLGTRDRFDRLDFQYSVDATDLISGTWIDVDQLDFITPDTSGIVGARDGNSTQSKTLLSHTILGLNIANASTFWIRWIDFNASNSDDGLAIDDFSIDETSLPVEISSFSAIVLENSAKLNWRTETEVNNYGFEVERLQDYMIEKLQDWKVIGLIEGNGNSNSPKDYSFVDEHVSTGRYLYRLKQIDTDGKFEYSKIIEVDLGSPAKFKLSQNYPNPFNPVTTISFAIPQSGNIRLAVFNILGEQVAELVNEFLEAGTHTINFNAEELNSGIYVYKLKVNGIVQTKRMMLIK